MSEPSPRPRKAAGPERPSYLRQDDVDRVMSVVLALASEVASLRDRLDTAERIAGTSAAIEAYTPDPATSAARETWRNAYIRRLFRVFSEDVEALSRPPSDLE